MSAYGRWVRWVVLAMTAAMGLVLAVNLWSSYLTAERAYRAVTMGQGHSLLGASMPLQHAARGALRRMDLEQILSRFEEYGLRYVATVTPDGRVLDEAGEPFSSGRAPDGRVKREPHGTLIELGTRVRMFAPLPPPPPPRVEQRALPPDAPPGEAAPEPDPAEPPPRAPRDEPFARPPQGPPHDRGLRERPTLMIEFEPHIANQLRAESRRTLVVGLGAAAALAVAALVVARILRQRDALEVLHERNRRLSALGEMSAVLSHEIRNPLTALKGHAQLLAESLPREGRDRTRVERVVREAMRLEELTTDLLDFVRAGQVERRPVDPVELLRESVEAVEPSRFDLDVASAPRSWSLDPSKMQQALTNLLDNALQASQDDARARASVRLEGGALTFAVRDFGHGIPAGEEERIFEPFHTTKAKGNGLGLAVTRRIVELHHGAIRARNHPDGGALFEISIPQA